MAVYNSADTVILIIMCKSLCSGVALASVVTKITHVPSFLN